MEMEKLASSRRMKRKSVETLMKQLEEELKKEEKSVPEIDSLIVEIGKLETVSDLSGCNEPL